jgi:hypothetical protein
MPVPSLKLNLVPPPAPWRQYHQAISWTVLSCGVLALLGVLAATGIAYRHAATAGRKAAAFDARSTAAARKQAAIEAQMQSIDVEKELPRWRLAERILAERSAPWSRLTAELERSLVQDVRIKNIQRTRDNAQKVLLKIKAEARSRAAEDALLESLRKNAFFAGAVLEREAEGQGGGLDFDFILPISPAPVPYAPLPKFGPSHTKDAAPSNPKIAKGGVSTVTKPVLRPAPSPIRPAAAPSLTPPASRPNLAPPRASAPVSTSAPNPAGSNRPPRFRPVPRPDQPRFMGNVSGHPTGDQP